MYRISDSFCSKEVVCTHHENKIGGENSLIQSKPSLVIRENLSSHEPIEEEKIPSDNREQNEEEMIPSGRQDRQSST